jgi:hypothetical protein
MKKVGIWIDHRRAVLITLDNGQESREVVESDIDQLEGPEGSRRTSTAYGPQVTDVERKVEGRAQHHLQKFYREIVKHIGMTDHLLIIGPAQAKQELADLIKEDPSLRAIHVKVEPADRMTDDQIAAKVRSAEF